MSLQLLREKSNVGKKNLIKRDLFVPPHRRISPTFLLRINYLKLAKNNPRGENDDTRNIGERTGSYHSGRCSSSHQVIRFWNSCMWESLTSQVLVSPSCICEFLLTYMWKSKVACILISLWLEIDTHYIEKQITQMMVEIVQSTYDLCNAPSIACPTAWMNGLDHVVTSGLLTCLCIDRSPRHQRLTNGYLIKNNFPHCWRKIIKYTFFTFQVKNVHRTQKNDRREKMRGLFTLTRNLGSHKQESWSPYA